MTITLDSPLFDRYIWLTYLCSDEVRRSGRATKGQHTKNIEEPELPTPKRGGKGSRAKASKQASTEASPPDDDGGDAIIRCICGYIEEDEDDERTMVICDRCEAWQHNECMEISENSDELPEQYYCEQCKPADHKELLAKIARGEKPWEERARQREREAEEKKSRRRRGGKKGKKGRPSEVHVEKNDGVISDGAPPSQPSAQPATTTTTPEVSQKRKLPTEETQDKIDIVEQVSHAVKNPMFQLLISYRNH